MNQSDFFKLLGAPLVNPQWSWGSIRKSDETLFLKVWQDEILRHDGRSFARVTFHAKWRDHPLKSGYHERIEHLSLLRSGKRCFLVMCEAAESMES